MPTQDLIAILFGLSLSGIWLIYKLTKFQWLQKIDDPKGIVIPSFIFLLSPFLAVWARPIFISGNISEIIRTIFPLVAFILGQLITKHDHEKDKKQKKIKIMKMMIHNLETNVIIRLGRIEGQLITLIKNTENEENIDRLKQYFKDFKPEMEKLHENISFQLEVFESDSVRSSLYYIEKIKNDVTRMGADLLDSSNNLLKDQLLYDLKYIRLHIIEGHENIISLIDEALSDYESVRNHFFNILNIFLIKEDTSDYESERNNLFNDLVNYIHRLNNERKTFLQSKELKKDIALYSQYDIDTESVPVQAITRLIQRIEGILQHFAMPIPNSCIDSDTPTRNLSDFD